MKHENGLSTYVLQIVVYVAANIAWDTCYYTLLTTIYCIETFEQYVQRNDDHMGTFSHIVGEPTKRFTIVN